MAITKSRKNDLVKQDLLNLLDYFYGCDNISMMMVNDDRATALKGENIMTAFDNGEFEKTKAEAKARWGDTAACKQYEEKTESYSAQEQDALAKGMDQIMEAFAACMKNGAAAAFAEAQALVQRLQSYITEHYYNCTNQILAGLGQMYVADERFRQNIDRHGAGAAAFICAAIKAYVGKQEAMCDAN